MKTFKTAGDIPGGFTGACFIQDRESICWFLNGQIHCEDGPAIIWKTGTKEWFQRNYIHRLDGPAIEWSDGNKWWYINNERYSQEEFLNHPLVIERKLKSILQA